MILFPKLDVPEKVYEILITSDPFKFEMLGVKSMPSPLYVYVAVGQDMLITKGTISNAISSASNI